MSDVKVVDARGLSCPQPVILTKRAAEKLGAGQIDILVDTATSRENVMRYARGAGWTAAAAADGEGFRVTIKK